MSVSRVCFFAGGDSGYALEIVIAVSTAIRLLERVDIEGVGDERSNTTARTRRN
jgi:hypothetical protein